VSCGSGVTPLQFPIKLGVDGETEAVVAFGKRALYVVRDNFLTHEVVVSKFWR
jgi:hypothetical protein